MLSRRALLAGLSLVCTVSLLPAIAGPAAAAGEIWYRLTNGKGNVLTVISEANGGAVMRWDRARGNDQGQAWRRVVDSNDGLLRFRNALTPSQFALTVKTSNDWVNKPMLVTAIGATFPNQGWSAYEDPWSESRFLLRNPYTNLCLGEPPNLGNIDAYAVLCDQEDVAQWWRFTRWS